MAVDTDMVIVLSLSGCASDVMCGGDGVVAVAWRGLCWCCSGAVRLVGRQYNCRFGRAPMIGDFSPLQIDVIKSQRKSAKTKKIIFFQI